MEIVNDFICTYFIGSDCTNGKFVTIYLFMAFCIFIGGYGGTLYSNDHTTRYTIIGAILSPIWGLFLMWAANGEPTSWSLPIRLWLQATQ